MLEMTPELDLGLQWCGELIKERFLQEVTFKVRHGTAVPKDMESSERDGNTRAPDLPLEKPICRSGSNS